MLEMLVVLIIGLPVGIGTAFLWMPTIGHFTLTGKIISHVIAYLFLLLALYLAISYTFVNLIIVDRDIGPWSTMELSRKIVAKKWFRLFFILILLVFALAIGAALLLVGLIWAVPFAQNVIARQF